MNLQIEVLNNTAAHPLPKLCQRGVACSINSDDALLFGSTLLSEFEMCRKELKMSDEVLAICARSSFRYSCSPKVVVEKALVDIEAWLEDGVADK